MTVRLIAIMLLIAALPTRAAEWLVVNASIYSETPRAIDVRSGAQFLLADLPYGSAAELSATAGQQLEVLDGQSSTFLASTQIPNNNGGILVVHGGTNDRPLVIEALQDSPGCNAASGYCSEVLNFAPLPLPNTGAEPGVGFQFQCLPSSSEIAGLQINRLTFGQSTALSGPFVPGATCGLANIATDDDSHAWTGSFAAPTTAGKTTRFLLIGDGTVAAPDVLSIVGRSLAPSTELSPPLVSNPGTVSLHFRQQNQPAAGLILEADDQGYIGIQYFHDPEGKPRWTLLRLTAQSSGFTGTQYWPVQDSGRVTFDVLAQATIETHSEGLTLSLFNADSSVTQFEYVRADSLPQ